MKKIAILIVIALSVQSIQSQGITDALRYGQASTSGTARFSAMGGAFGALGGDLSAIGVNPAGSVIFANNQVGGTVSNTSINNESTYFGKKNSQNKNSFDLNQAGAVFVFDNDNRKSMWKKFALALNYDSTSNLDNQTNVSGVNPTNSIDKYFLNYANGVRKSVFDTSFFDEMSFGEQQGYLGYQAYIVDPNTNSANNTSYFTNVAQLGNYTQTNVANSLGNIGKVCFNFSTQYADKLSLGINLNSHFSDFRRTSRFTETNTNPDYATGVTVNNIQFNNDLQTKASGFSLQLGLIYKPIKEVRFGLAYESPTWYRVEERLTQSITTKGVGFDAANPTVYSSTTVNPNYTTVFEPYDLRTAAKATGSFAYVFGKKGLFSADFSVKDYSGMKFSPDNQFVNANNSIRNNLNIAKEVRLGAEYKIDKLSLRGGYRWEESPFKINQTYGDLSIVSGGLGYNFGATKIDLTYARSQRDYNESFFNVGLTDKALTKEIRQTISLSVLFEL